MRHPRLIIENRDELIFLLCEAAQIEHMVMCQYLFAAFSLKREPSEGLTPEQLEAVLRWDRAISAVAAQEMLHLALVSNLLTAVGGAPYFDRPNFPQVTKYFPSSVQFRLIPFDQPALQHFLYLERPEGMTLQDASIFRVGEDLSSRPAEDDILPEMQDFTTISELYHGVEAGMRRLVDKFGEKKVFVGPPRAQATGAYFRWPELVAVTDLASAIQAIEVIVEQGEGARGHREHSHFGQFVRLTNEFLGFKQIWSDFTPARPVDPAFVRPPGDVDDALLITDGGTRCVAELFNASYELLLQMLARFFIHSDESDAALKTLADTAVDLMFAAIRPLGRLLTTLPIGDSAPGSNAGPSFEMYRTSYLLPHRYAAWHVMHERLLEFAAYSEQTRAHHPELGDLAKVENGLKAIAMKLAAHLDEP